MNLDDRISSMFESVLFLKLNILSQKQTMSFLVSGGSQKYPLTKTICSNSICNFGAD